MSRCLCRRASGDCGRTHRRHSRRVCRRKARRESSRLSRRVCCRRRRLHALVLELRLMRHVLLQCSKARRTLALVSRTTQLHAFRLARRITPAVVSADIAVMSSGLGGRILGGHRCRASVHIALALAAKLRARFAAARMLLHDLPEPNLFVRSRGSFAAPSAKAHHLIHDRMSSRRCSMRLRRRCWCRRCASHHH